MPTIVRMILEIAILGGGVLAGLAALGILAEPKSRTVTMDVAVDADRQ